MNLWQIDVLVDMRSRCRYRRGAMFGRNGMSTGMDMFVRRSLRKSYSPSALDQCKNHSQGVIGSEFIGEKQAVYSAFHATHANHSSSPINYRIFL